MQFQYSPWPKRDCAMAQSVSPFFTTIFVAGAEVFSDVAASFTGRERVVPGMMRSGFVTAGLMATSSCQREPLPKFFCASVQSESPTWTVIVVTPWIVALRIEVGTSAAKAGLVAGSY